MYWQLESLFFENEAHYPTAFCVWKPKYIKMEYKVNIQDRICSVGDGRRWDRIKNWECCVVDCVKILERFTITKQEGGLKLTVWRDIWWQFNKLCEKGRYCVSAWYMSTELIVKCGLSSFEILTLNCRDNSQYRTSSSYTQFSN